MVTGLVFFALAIAAAVIATRGGRNLESAAVARVASRKHVRIAFDHGRRAYRITYYGDNGRKLTQRRNVSSADVIRLRKLAQSRGYAAIIF